MRSTRGAWASPMAWKSLAPSPRNNGGAATGYQRTLPKPRSAVPAVPIASQSAAAASLAGAPMRSRRRFRRREGLCRRKSAVRANGCAGASLPGRSRLLPGPGRCGRRPCRANPDRELEEGQRLARVHGAARSQVHRGGDLEGTRTSWSGAAPSFFSTGERQRGPRFPPMAGSGGQVEIVGREGEGAALSGRLRRWSGSSCGRGRGGLRPADGSAAAGLGSIGVTRVENESIFPGS